MNEPTPKKSDRSDWPMVIFLCVATVAIASVCIVGMLIRADILR